MICGRLRRFQYFHFSATGKRTCRPWRAPLPLLDYVICKVFILCKEGTLQLKMGSQSAEILRQGIWASLTGGWFYDPRKPIFCNTFHMYLWLYLVCAPFSIYVVSSFILFTYNCDHELVGILIMKQRNQIIYPYAPLL